MGHETTRPRGNALRSVATLACVLLIYYGIPLDWGAGAGRVADIIGLTLFIVAMVGIVWLLRLRVRRYIHAVGQIARVATIRELIERPP